MATRYRFGDSEYPYFITFAIINWIDALSRPIYKDIVINSLKYCQQEKGLIINAKPLCFDRIEENNRTTTPINNNIRFYIFNPLIFLVFVLLGSPCIAFVRW